MFSRFRLLVLCVVLTACGTKDASSTAPSIVVTSIQLSVASQSLRIGATMQATVAIADQNGKPVAGESVSWTTSDGTVASVSSAGLITGVGVGSATITAISAGKSGSVTVQVTAVPIARIVVSPSTLTVQPWQTGTLSAVAYDSAGNQLSGRSFSWISSDTIHASVSSLGVVTGNLVGTFTITASSAGQSGTSSVKIAPSTAVMVGPNIPLDANVAASETMVAINPLNPLNIVASANWNHFFSFNGGRTWSRGADVTGDGQPQGDPNVAFDRHGTVYRQGLDVYHAGQLNSPQAPRGVTVQSSVDGGRTLLAPVYAYKPPPYTGSPDQGILTIDTVQSSPYVGNLYVTAADYQSAGYLPSYPAVGFPMIALISRDGGKTWDSPIDISDSPLYDQESSEYVTTGEKGQVYAAWQKGGGSQMHVIFTRSLDGGRTWAPNIVVRTLPLPLNINTYSTDIRGNITIDVDRSNGPNRGTIYLSSVDLNGASGGAADAWMVKSTDGGNTWSSSVLLSDAPRGPNKYDFQPRISVAPNGRVDAAWYGITGWSGTGIPSYDVYYSYSANGGVSFSPSVRVTSASSVKNLTVFGEYMGLASDSTRALVTWTDLRTGTYLANFAIIWNTAMPSGQSLRRTNAPAIKQP